MNSFNISNLFLKAENSRYLNILKQRITKEILDQHHPSYTSNLTSDYVNVLYCIEEKLYLEDHIKQASNFIVNNVLKHNDKPGMPFCKSEQHIPQKYSEQLLLLTSTVLQRRKEEYENYVSPGLRAVLISKIQVGFTKNLNRQETLSWIEKVINSSIDGLREQVKL